MSDIIERLRAGVQLTSSPKDRMRLPLLDEAASEIARLTERCDAYKEALSELWNTIEKGGVICEEFAEKYRRLTK